MSTRKIGIILFFVGILAFCGAWLVWLYNERIEQLVVEYSEQKAQSFISHLQNGHIVRTTADMDYIILEDGESYIGLLSIPTLNLSLPVNKFWSYAALRNTPCRFSGDIESDSIVIAAHNYASHFRNIANLEIGASVILTDVDGVEHRYAVAEITIVQPTDTALVVHSDFDLTLFTCTYTGQARVVVRCMRY